MAAKECVSGDTACILTSEGDFFQGLVKRECAAIELVAEAKTEKFSKMVMDRFGAAALILFLLPVLLIIAAGIKATSPGPVLFTQNRWGRDQTIIRVYKFRSMRKEAEDALCLRQTGVNDNRVTPLGNFLRRTSLDELPQLFNVLQGNMSLVGPRPHALGMTVEGKSNIEIVPEYFLRYSIKPGITGLAQVRGFRGPADTAEHLSRRVSCDLEYIHSHSLALDLSILLKTIVRVYNDPNAR